MAQAARLSLRMQKELKLLLSDPPPGATFPYLTSDCSSLSAIDAQIEGPKGTVYQNGYFHIKIQIPERYPFQPPVVTFATPIYHPNIDTGGRICLDILNLPPKGAWQPSLNISTVITSIGLLLSEPNPDDGLMCEASKEYKYNRQAFDQKARSMTEKYAKALIGGSSSNKDFLISSSSSQVDEKVTKNEEGSEVNNMKIPNPSRNLSLQSSVSSTNSNDMRVACQPNISLHRSHNEMEHSLKSKQDPCSSNRNDGTLSGMRQKLSLAGSCQSGKRSCDEMKTPHDGGGGGLSCQDVGVGLEAKSPVSQKTASCSNKHRVSNKKLNLGNQNVEDNTKEDNKENIPHVALHLPTSEPSYQPCEPHSVFSSVIDKHAGEKTVNSKINPSNEEQRIRSRLSLQPLRSLQANHEPKIEVNTPNKVTGHQVQVESEPPISSEVIVMDSEDEEEKDKPVRSKVMVARRRLGLAGKRKAKE